MIQTVFCAINRKTKLTASIVLPRTNCPVEKERHLHSIWMAPAKAQLVRGSGIRIILFITEFITELA
jgi:hypothetical protein